MVWHKDKWLSPALSAFLALSREMLATRTCDEGEDSDQLNQDERAISANIMLDTEEGDGGSNTQQT
jgi:hypothetical protein